MPPLRRAVLVLLAAAILRPVLPIKRAVLLMRERGRVVVLHGAALVVRNWS